MGPIRISSSSTCFRVLFSNLGSRTDDHDKDDGDDDIFDCDDLRFQGYKMVKQLLLSTVVYSFYRFIFTGNAP